MPSPRLAALEILAAANNAPQQLEIERQKAARGAQTTQLVGGAVQSLVPQLAGAGGQLYSMAAKDATDAGAADALARYGDLGGSAAPASGGDDLDALAKVRAGMSAPGGYAQGPGAYAQKLADDNPDLAPGSSALDQLFGNGLKDKRREAFLSSAVPQIAKQRADAQAASEHAVDRANLLDEGNIKRTTERTNAAKDVLGSSALPASTLDLGYSDLQRLTADPTAPDLTAGIKSRDQQFYEANKSALDSLGIGSAFGQNLAGGNLASRDAMAAKEAEAEKEAARQRDTQSAAQKEQERANRAREGLGWAEMSQRAKDAAANRQAELDRAKVAAGVKEDKPLPPVVIDKITPYDKVLGALDDIAAQKRKLEAQDVSAVGKMSTVGNKLAHTVGWDVPEVTSFRSDLEGLAANFRKDMSGTAVSAAEMSRLEDAIPSPGDSSETFDKKLETFKVRLSHARQAEIQALSNGNYDMRKFGAPAAAAPPAAAPSPRDTLKAAAVAMKQAGMSDQQIADALSKAGH